MHELSSLADEPCRVIVHVAVLDIPGPPLGRYNVVGDVVCQQLLGRDFVHLFRGARYDYVHIPPMFFTDKPVRKWFICDLNVGCRRTRTELLALPQFVYGMRLDGGQWSFVPKTQRAAAVKDYCKMYYWGGRQEQDWYESWRLENAVLPSSENDSQAERSLSPSRVCCQYRSRCFWWCFAAAFGAISLGLVFLQDVLPISG